MPRVTIPQSMKLATIWVMWGILALGAMGWGLQVIVSAVKPGGAVADWVQAVGSIVAIIGAGAFPYLHESHKEHRQQVRARALLRLLAQRQEAELLKLWEVLHSAQNDPGMVAIAPHVNTRALLLWPSQVAALDAVPMVDLDAFSVLGLGDLKIGAAFAVQLSDRLFGGRIQELTTQDWSTLFNHYQVAQVVAEALHGWLADD